jgi:hypothetical protein
MGGGTIHRVIDQGRSPTRLFRSPLPVSFSSTVLRIYSVPNSIMRYIGSLKYQCWPEYVEAIPWASFH